MNFTGETPDNYEQKCLCVLVLDVSGSMSGAPINQLNLGLQDFHREIMTDFIAAQRLEVAIVSFGSNISTVQEPALVNNFQMPTLITSGTTKLVDAVRVAINLVESRKHWYKETGQNYYRPFIVLITDGEPDADQDITGLASEVKSGVSNKRFTFYAIGVQGYNHSKLSAICPSQFPPLPLDGLKFGEFFKWLSNSIGIITKSNEGDTVSLEPVNGWAQITI